MPKLLPIITNPNPILRKKAKKISPETVKTIEFQELCADMALTMQKKDGVGLAAPQIGKNIRLLVISTKDGPKHIINPRFIKKSYFKEWGVEGCLSVPNTFGQVKRHKKIIVNYLDEKGKKNTTDASGLLARILQHEIDHLDGVLFIDIAKNIKSS